jgi:predicted ATPase
VRRDHAPPHLERVEPLRLPAPDTALIGRSADIDELERLLGRTRVLTLTGPGGAGKTRIAGELARRQTGRPVWFVDLSVLADEELVATTAARTVGAVHGPEQSPVDAIVHRLQELPGLLVLDNCEHVIDAAGRLAAALQRGCPELIQVTTSRRPLRLSGEVTWPVPPLPTPDRDAVLTADVSDVPAVQLFVERARAVRPDFSLTDDNAADVAAIVRGLDGLPLAIELAAAHADVLTAASIRSRLLDRFDLLESGTRDTPARQRTLRAVIDSSVSLLDDAERHFFVRLGAFAGSFDLAAAAAVTGSADAFRMTASLVRQSLVVTTGTGRYRLLESVRAYAAQALASEPDVVDVRSRHCEHLIDLMTQADAGIRADGQDAWLARIHDTLPDVRSALSWSLGGAAPQRGALLAAKANWFWTLEGMLAEAGRWLDLAEAAPIEDDTVRAAVLLAVGRIAAPRGDLDRALTACAESAEISRRLGDDRACADALVTLGIAQWATGDLAGAASSHDEAVRLAAAAGDSFVRDTALVLRSRTAVDAGEPDAELLIDAAIVRARRSREKHRIGLALAQQARHALLAGNGQTAYNAAQESLANWQRVGYREGEVNALNLLARASTVLDRPAEAEEFAVQALRGAAAIGHRGAMCQGSESLAGALHASGDDERAALLLAVSSAERRRRGIPAPSAEAAQLDALVAAVRERAGRAAERAERQAAYLTVDDLIEQLRSDRS